MSDPVVLTMRSGITDRVEADGIAADRLAALAGAHIAALPVLVGGRAARLGDVFDVRGGSSSRLRIEGDLRNVDNLAAGMTGGEIVVDGSVGAAVGARMTGGWIDIRGDAGDEAGLAMAGGALRITGNAGDRVGAGAPGASKGMTGGEIIVNGSAGSEVGARMRRGLIVIGERAGDDAARAMIAGTLMVFGPTGARPGRGSKRGSIVALGDIDVPSTYVYACTYQPPHVRLTLTYLRRRYGLSHDTALDGRYRRYCGDAGGIAKGEILQLVLD